MAMKRRNFIRDAAIGSIALTGVTGTFASTAGCTREKRRKTGAHSFTHLSGFKELTLEDNHNEIIIKGGTFEYTISKSNGLLSSARVLGDEWLAGPMPDLWASGDNDPRNMPYFARFTPEAELEIRESSPHVIVISTGGLFALINGTTLPLNYSLLYTFDVDGTVRVDVRSSARENIVVRWLTLMEGRISGTCRFVSHEFDVSNGPRTCTPANFDIDQEINVGGKFIPWFHFGNDKSGLELVFPNSDRRFGSYTDSSPFTGGDPLGRAWDMFTLKKDDRGLLCTSFGIRNHREVIGPDHSFEDTFFISAMPGRTVRPDANSVQIQWTGPHQYRSNWRHPGEEDIRRWAAGGVNTVVGGANWYSGDYGNCSMPEETRQFLDQCHHYGLKVIPYVTFTDQEYPTPGFDETGPRWRIEPVTEFSYRSQLMCYGAEEWQDHWHNEINSIFDQFPFDGLYIDFWAGKMNCYNTRHGCTGQHGRFTAEGLRRMARIAREIVDTRTEHGFILSNTNILPLAMINNWMDARLYGEWGNLENTDPLSLRIYYNAHRYGTGNVLFMNRTPISERSLALSGLFQGYPVISHARTPEHRSLLERNALFLDAFGANQSVALNKFEIGDVLPQREGAGTPGVSAYIRPDNGACLICLSTFAQPACVVDLGPALKSIISKIDDQLNSQYPFDANSPCYFYVFEEKKLIGERPLTLSELNGFRFNLPAESYRNIWIKPFEKEPSLLYSLSNDAQPSDFATDGDDLVLTIPSKARTSAESVILGPAPKSVRSVDGAVNFTAYRGWWEGELPCNTGVRITY
jgi:hypothetical protein